MSNHYEKGLKQVECNQFRNAIKSFTESIENEEKILESLLHRSSCYLHLKNFAEAAEDLSRAIDIDPTYEEFYYNRAMAYVNLQEYDKALNDYSIAVTLNPKYKNAYYNKASVHMKLDQHEKAVENFLEAGALGHKEALIVCKHFNQRGEEINENKNKDEKPEEFTPEMARQLLATLKKNRN